MTDPAVMSSTDPVNTTHRINYPTGSGRLFLGLYTPDQSSKPTFTPPAGQAWAPLTISDSSGRLGMSWLDDPTGAFSFGDWISSLAVKLVAGVWRIADADTAVAPALSGSVVGSGTTVLTPAVTWPWAGGDDTVVLSFYGKRRNYTVLTFPPGYANTNQIQTSVNNNSDGNMGTCSLDLTAPGVQTEDPGSYLLSGGTGTSHAYTYAQKLGAVVPPVTPDFSRGAAAQVMGV